MQLSESYKEKIRKGNIGGKIKGEDLLKVRSEIVFHASDAYRIVRSSGTLKIISAIEEKLGFKISKQKVFDEIQHYRKAYLYFKGTDAEKSLLKKRLESGDTRMKFIRHLLKDGFTEWDEKTKMPIKLKESTGEIQVHVPAQTLTEEDDPLNVDAVISDTAVFLGEMLDIFSKKKELLEFLGEHFKKVLVSLKDAKEEADKEKALREELEEEMTLLKKEFVESKSLCEMYDEEIDTLNNKVNLLEEKLKATPNQKTLTKIAKEMAVVAGLDQEVTLAQEKSSSDSKEECITEKHLPKRMKFSNLAAQYSSHFLKSFNMLNEKDKKTILKALNDLSKHGSKYPSLRTNKLIPGTSLAKFGSNESRAGINYRFFWKTNKKNMFFTKLATRENFS